VAIVVLHRSYVYSLLARNVCDRMFSVQKVGQRNMDRGVLGLGSAFWRETTGAGHRFVVLIFGMVEGCNVLKRRTLEARTAKALYVHEHGRFRRVRQFELALNAASSISKFRCSMC
jgi:hypothetical protein